MRWQINDMANELYRQRKPWPALQSHQEQLLIYTSNDALADADRLAETAGHLVDQQLATIWDQCDQACQHFYATTVHQSEHVSAPTVQEGNKPTVVNGKTYAQQHATIMAEGTRARRRYVRKNLAAILLNLQKEIQTIHNLFQQSTGSH